MADTPLLPGLPPTQRAVYDSFGRYPNKSLPCSSKSLKHRDEPAESKGT